MKYYKLIKDLPTFKAGELFILNDTGLWHSTGGRHVDVMAYAKKTLELFPNILEDWFEEAPKPVRDNKTKEAFIEYLDKCKDERFFQAIRNFAREYLGDEFNLIYSSKMPIDVSHDTFYLECDRLHELKEEDDEEQRASEYLYKKLSGSEE